MIFKGIKCDACGMTVMSVILSPLSEVEGDIVFGLAVVGIGVSIKIDFVFCVFLFDFSQ